ncbi:MAG: hypothetical protein JWM56_1263 [Candidatus Peribacteria bacterium]|nr:hypothetical protein [Candidatus Peribacteria bacterium]
MQEEEGQQTGSMQEGRDDEGRFEPGSPAAREAGKEGGQQRRT